MLQRLLLTLCLLCSLVARADVRLDPRSNAVSMPYSDWELRFPAEGWELGMQRATQDGFQLYYLFSNAATGLVAAFFLEPAWRCENSVACRDLFWKDPGAMAQGARQVRMLEDTGFQVIEFAGTADGSAPQRHWSAHMLRDGVWIDVHLSMPEAAGKDFAAHAAFLRGVSFAAKPFCPICQKQKGLSRRDSTILAARVNGGDEPAWKRLLALAEAGDAEAQFTAARVYSWAAPMVVPDERKSVLWLQKAAEQGHADAQANLGYMYSAGRGLEQGPDAEAAVRWWTRAAGQGYALAQLNLGVLYANEGKMKDEAKAVEWMRKAAEQGLAAAQTSLAMAYARGFGVKQDRAKALEWYAKAGAQGDTGAMFSAATLLGEARGDAVQVLAAIDMLLKPIFVTEGRAKTLMKKICRDNPEICAGRGTPLAPAGTPASGG